MIHFIGNGGHAKVCREVELKMRDILNREFAITCFVAIGDNADRARAAKERLGPFATLIHPMTTICNANIGEGTVVMAHVVVQPNVKIGKHCILNTGCTVDHDCIIEDYAHIAPGAHLCGGVHVGEGALVGVGVAVAPGGKIPAWSIAKARRLEIEPVTV